MDLSDFQLYRKRYIPNETILLKDDIIYYIDHKLIKTKWKVLKPRKDFACGISWYYLDKGWKISRFMDKDGKLVYYYCDIIDAVFSKDNKSCVVRDLLADVKVYPDGKVEVVDLEEIADALDKKIITVSDAKKSLRRLDSLLKIIYSGKLGSIFDLNDNGENV